MKRNFSFLTQIVIVALVFSALFLGSSMATAQENQPLAPVGTGFTYGLVTIIGLALISANSVAAYEEELPCVKKRIWFC